jgi:serpin B
MQIIRLPYQTGNLEMWIALPPEGAMFQLLEILANEGMDYLKSDTEEREVILSLPKFDVSDDNTLAEALKLLGVEAAFADTADFSGISDTGLCVDEILQKVRVQVDEQGTKAAAATALMMREMGLMPMEEPVEMNVNRPFAFVISDAETGRVCFAGAIENPVA